MNKDRFVEDIILYCRENHFAKQAWCQNDALSNEIADNLVEGIKGLDPTNRVVRIDLSGCNSFSDLLSQILIILFDDPKFSNDDTLVVRDDFQDEDDEGELCYQLNCVLKEDFKLANIHTLVIFEHFEAVRDIWNSGNFGWMRGLLCDSRLLSIVILSSVRANEVSEEPRGSSPFYNIFDIVPVE